MARLAAVRTSDAVDAVVPYLDDDALKSAAAISVGRQIVPAQGYTGMEGRVAAVALGKATPLVTEESLKEQMAKHLDKIRVEPEATGVDQ